MKLTAVFLGVYLLLVKEGDWVHRGRNSSMFILPVFPTGSTLEGKNVLLQEQMLFFGIRCHFGRASFSR